MNQSATCPHCGKPLQATALQGLCPECMLAAAMPTGAGEPGKAAPPPSVEEIAKYFPQLEIIECIGRGGMGVLYRARQPQLDRLVALKILAPEKEHDPAFGERFAREAQALAKLSHPNIVTVFDFGKANGLYFLLMEFVEGANLRSLIRSVRMTPEEALAIVPKICEALQFAHEHGIVHRDIKPENILLDKHGRVKIADFGIAKLIGTTKEHGITQERHSIGTPHYMAPEQVEHPDTVDHRADIYSLGVVFYEMLTGELPLGKFARPSVKVQMDVRLDEVVLRALEKEPARRYQAAQEIKTDVETIASSSAPKTPPPDTELVSRDPFRPSTIFPHLALALFIIGILGTLVLLPLTSKDHLVLLFGATALGFTAVFAFLSWGAKTSRALVAAIGVILLGAGLTMGMMSEVIPLPFTASRSAAAARQQLEKIREVQQAAALARARSAHHAPPVVVSTIPMAGSSDVDPALDSIQVTFSKPMHPSAWSWVQEHIENFPELTGDPSFSDDALTCSVPVKLLPGKVYAIWINSEQFNNFKDQEGRPAVPYLLVFKTKER